MSCTTSPIRSRCASIGGSFLPADDTRRRADGGRWTVDGGQCSTHTVYPEDAVYPADGAYPAGGAQRRERSEGGRSVRAGVARACITPPVGTWQGGYGARYRPAEGITDDRFG